MIRYKESKYNLLVNQNERFSILYNCYNGGIIQLENQVYELLKQSNFFIESIPYGNDLLRNGFIVNSSIDEFQRVKTEIETTIRNRNQDMISYVIAPTLNCNMRCVYCFQQEFRTEGSENTISKDVIEKTRQFIYNNSKGNPNLKRIKITWFGGEPMLCFGEIVSFSNQLKADLGQINVELNAAMITNGSLLDEEKLQVLVKECNLKNIQITLDGEVHTYCEKKQTTSSVYEKVLDNICIATKYLKTAVRVNADKNNFEELRRLINSLYHSDINKENLTVHFAQLRDYNCDNCEDSECFNDLEYWQSKEEFYNSLKEFEIKGNKNTVPSFSRIPFCGLATGNNLVIDYLGNLYKCEHYIGDETKVVGNITDGLFYNEVYKQSLFLSTDERCEMCDIFPCCNYSQCVAMHKFSGRDSICKCYENQFETLKLKAKKYLEEQ